MPTLREQTPSAAGERAVEHLPTDGFPTTGGTPAHITVTIGEAKLRSEVAATTLSTGGRISAGELRRLACGHGILPTVLGGASIPIDLGRDQRLFTRRQRDALAVMDGGCVAPGCDRPPAWCEAHHGGVPFSEGGRTNLNEGYLLCSSHHHEAHQHRWRLPIDRELLEGLSGRTPTSHIIPGSDPGSPGGRYSTLRSSEQ